MATQRILLVTIGGALAASIWEDIQRWSDCRTTDSREEWSSDQWPAAVRQQIDQFVAKIDACAFTPPILYRSEHVDCWSMGDVFETALVKPHRDCSRQLRTERHEIIATRVHYMEQIVLDPDAPRETEWLYHRVNEAISAWSEFGEDRMVVLVRSVIRGLFTDEEVVDSLKTIPEWWNDNAIQSAT